MEKEIEGNRYECRRTYECSFCDRTAPAGSDELLEDWKKWGVGAETIGYACGKHAHMVPVGPDVK